MKKKIGFIGAGLINQYCHIPAIRDQQNLELNSICDLDKDLLESVSNKFSFKNKYSDINELLKNKEIDALVVTVARKDTLKILEYIYQKRNIKILCEKPFGLNSIKGKNLIKKYPQKTANTMIGYMKKYEQAIIDLKNIILNKKYGNLISVTIKNSMGDSYCNPFNYIKRHNLKKYINDIKKTKNFYFERYLNVFCHDYNLITDLLDKKVVISSVNLSKKGIGRVNLLFKNIPVSIDTSFNNKKKWYESFKFNFNNAEIKINFPAALSINQQATLVITDYETNKQIKNIYNSNWAFRIQAQKFEQFISNKIKNTSKPIDAVFDINLIENIWKKI